MNTANLKRQHTEVMALAGNILGYIKTNTVVQNLNDIAKSINIITGKLNIHLLNEDKYLYPLLLNSSEPSLNSFGKKYSDEMIQVAKAYEDYKSKYNTAIKIQQDIVKFSGDTKRIFEALSGRIKREENELYPLLK
jgi:hypothetical protein